MSAAQVNVEHMFEYWYASRPTPESAAPLGRVREAARAEAQAAARRLVAIGELLVLRCRATTRRKTGPSASPPNADTTATLAWLGMPNTRPTSDLHHPAAMMPPRRSNGPQSECLPHSQLGLRL